MEVIFATINNGTSGNDYGDYGLIYHDLNIHNNREVAMNYSVDYFGWWSATEGMVEPGDSSSVCYPRYGFLIKK